MLVGTNTVAVDDPLLTVRDEHDRPLAHQPLRAVMGERDLDPGRRIFDDDAETRPPAHPRPARRARRAATPATASTSSSRAARPWPPPSCGPAWSTRSSSYVAPMLLGAGRSAVADLGITTIADAFRPRVTDITVLEPASDGEEPNVRLTLTPARRRPDVHRNRRGARHRRRRRGPGRRDPPHHPRRHRARGRRPRRLDLGQRLLPDRRRRATATPGPPTSCRRRSTRPAWTASAPATGSTSSARSPPTSGSAATSSRATSTASAPS